VAWVSPSSATPTGVLLAVAGCYLYFISRRNPGDGIESLAAIGWVFLVVVPSVGGGVFVIVTVAYDSGTLHRLAIFQGILAVLAGPMVTGFLMALKVPTMIAWVGGTLAVVPPWAVYKLLQRVNTRPSTDPSTKMKIFPPP
jgi:hypothetical protein